MNAIILAAGRGSRLQGLTEERPKCLLSLAGRTLLDWQLTALREAGVRDVLVVRGYKSELIQGDFSTADNPGWRDTNMVATLLCAASWLRAGPCIVSYADIVYHPDHVRDLIRASGDVVITYDSLWESLWRERFADPFSDAESFQERDGYLRTIGSRPRGMDDVEGQYMGLLKFTPMGWGAACRVLESLDDQRVERIDMTGLLQEFLQRGVATATVRVAGRWCEVDQERDLVTYAERIRRIDEHGESWSHDWRAAPGDRSGGNDA